MKSTNWTNAAGLPDPNHYTTARDIATLGYRALLVRIERKTMRLAYERIHPEQDHL